MISWCKDYVEIYGNIDVSDGVVTIVDESDVSCGCSINDILRNIVEELELKNGDPIIIEIKKTCNYEI